MKIYGASRVMRQTRESVGSFNTAKRTHQAIYLCREKLEGALIPEDKVRQLNFAR